MRRLVALGSLTGAPGVTTTALALAAAWPLNSDAEVRPVVVEMDGSGGDLMIRFGLPATPSLLDVAAAARQPSPGSLLGAAHELPFGVRAVASVPGRGPCTEAVRLLASEAGWRVLRGEDSDRGTVLLDVGRWGDDVKQLVGSADQVVLVARGGAEPLTNVSAYGPGAELHLGRLTLAVVGPCPYPAEEIARALGIGRVVFLPWDARSVAAMSSGKHGVPRTSGFRTPPLMAAARKLAQEMAMAPQSEAGREPTGDGAGMTQTAGAEGSAS